MPGCELIDLPGGRFLMGNDDEVANPGDGERPVRETGVAPFRIGRCAVTNREFAAFVDATGHVTQAERDGFSFVFHLLLPPAAPPTRAVAAAPWWRRVPGANWRHPAGPSTSVDDRMDHPVVHVSFDDAAAFAAWAGGRLPTETEWEYAARGGLEQARYPWGDELTPDGEHRCNIWQGDFPGRNTAADGYVGTCPADAFAPNGYGLHNTSGNVWEWCDAWFHPDTPERRVMRGGSYLCHDSYCNRYRVAARSATDPDAPSGNLGFRLAADATDRGRTAHRGADMATPHSYGDFRGEVGRTFAESEPWWPPRPRPPEGAPNVVVILVDDLGYSDLGCYGSEIDTPHLDRLAAGGARYTDFHVTPMCSPTRASLLTGVNHHRAGVGHVAHSDPGFPGYAMELAEDVATTAELLRDRGYATFMAGKWHLCKDSDVSDGGSKHSWPLQRGFDHFYGILDGFTNLHHPHRLIRDNSAVEVDAYPDDFYLTDALTDQSIAWLRSITAEAPGRPFFLYLAHPAVHAPLHVRAEDADRYRGAYDAGWDEIRAARHRRQIELGIIDESTPLPPRNDEEGHDVPAWEELSEREQALMARYMELYAAMVTDLDEEVGRLLGTLDELGVADDTVVLFTSDNGASKEGEERGTSQYLRTLLHRGGIVDFEDLDADWERRELLGGPRTLPHYPRGWAMACNTPFRLYKTNAHAGGHTVPLIVSWPGRVEETDAVRRQYTHVTDVLPTLLELIGVERPEQRGGTELAELAGTSFAATLADPDARHGHDEQYYELEGNRGYYRDGWEIVTLHQPMQPFSDEEWELYDHAQDPTQVRDLSDEHPGRVADLAEAWEQAAWDNRVFPLDEGSGLKFVLRPDREEVLEQPLTLRPGTPTLDRYRSLLLVRLRSFDVEVELEQGAGDQGVLVAHGDQGGGYALAVEDDRLHLAYNAFGELVVLDAGPVPPGAHEIVASFHAPGGFRWDVSVSVDGEDRGGREGLPMLTAMAPFEGIDVGIDRRSPVSWPLYERHGPFPFTGTGLRTVTYRPGPPAPEAADGIESMLRELGRQIGARYE